MKRPALLISLLTLLSLFTVAADKHALLTPSQIDSIISVTPAVPMEGVWQFLPDNAAIAIIRQPGTLTHSAPTRFNIFLYSTVTSRILPGTFLGTLTATPEPDTFLAEMLANPSGKSDKIKKYIVKLNNPSHISFARMKSGISVNLWRLIPYLFRFSITRENPNMNIDGCVKIKPLVPGVSEPVRYL